MTDTAAGAAAGTAAGIAMILWALATAGTGERNGGSGQAAEERHRPRTVMTVGEAGPGSTDWPGGG